jgi:hypothetical protein
MIYKLLIGECNFGCLLETDRYFTRVEAQYRGHASDEFQAILELNVNPTR